MSFGKGKLCNSSLDIAVDSVLPIAIAAAYTPQITTIISNDSNQGLSPYFLLFHALYSNIQFAHALIFAARAYPNTSEPVLALISDGRLKGWEAIGGVSGLVQVGTQWLGSMMLVITSASHPSNATPGSLERERIDTTIAIPAFVHAAVFLLPSMIIALPDPSPRDWGNMIFVGFSLLVNTWVALFCVLAQFVPQYVEMRRLGGEPGALSLGSVAMQSMVMLAVAVRWLLRLGKPTWGA